MQVIHDPIAARLATSGVEYAPEIVQAARRHGIDPRLLAAVAAQETGGPGANAGRNIVGDGGHGHGVFQIDDRWHDFAKTPGAMDPAKNADYAAGMISGLLKRYGGNVRAALSAYNAGSPHATGTKTTWADGRTLGYADSVLRHEQQLGGATAEPTTLAAARAEEGTTADLVNGPIQNLLALAQQLGSSAVTPAPSLPQPWRPHTTGVDATGHKTGSTTDYDAYINGDGT